MDQLAFERDVSERSSANIENELLTLNANLNAATYRFLVLIREFDRRVAWGDWGMHSMAQWLGWRCGIGIVAAREHLRVATALAELPATSALLAEGRISYSKVRALTRVATAETEGSFSTPPSTAPPATSSASCAVRGGALRWMIRTASAHS